MNEIVRALIRVFAFAGLLELTETEKERIKNRHIKA
jgi:hypothetical protein